MNNNIMDYINPVRIFKHVKELSCILDEVKCGSSQIVNNLNANGIKIDEYKAQRQQKLIHNH